jgi:hypothetical protein
MSDRQLSCPSWIGLSDDDVTRLTSLPGAAHLVPQRVWCEMEVGHGGRHAGLGQDSFDGLVSTAWWIWWPERAYEIAAGAPCPVIRQGQDEGQDAGSAGSSEDDDDSESCLLPANHPGRHSFQF